MHLLSHRPNAIRHDVELATLSGDSDREASASPRLQPWVKRAHIDRSHVPPRSCDGVVHYRLSNTVVFSTKYHIIWCPKYRRPVLVGTVESRLRELVRGIAREHHANVLAMEVMPDHVHLLVQLPPAVLLSRFVGILKGRSSRVLRREHPHLQRIPCLRSPPWFVSSVGGAPLAVVKRYVENQKVA